MNIPKHITLCKNFLLQKGFPETVDSVVILGSGLGDFINDIDQALTVPYSEIPTFPNSSVDGHSGLLVYGFVAKKPVIAFSGRFHNYEGYPFLRTVLPVHIASAFNTKKLIISNAAGAINMNFEVGDLMVIEDIIRPFHSVSAFPSQKFRYSLYETAGKVKKIAAKMQLEVQRGCYIYVKGPNYETKAEICAFRIIGADVVGMSTAPELIEASRLGIQCAAISLITNMAAGISGSKLDHSEVKDAAESRKDDFSRFVTGIISEL